MANDNAGPFSLGQVEQWPGLAKLVEECGEVLQIAGKLIATGGDTSHWSGLDLGDCLTEELGDVLASALFVIENSDISEQAVWDRVLAKTALYEEWHGQNIL